MSLETLKDAQAHFITRDEVCSRLIKLDKELDESRAVNITVTAAISALKEAGAVERESINKRLDGMNEFREALKDQTAQYITRTEHEIRHVQLDKDMEALKSIASSHITREEYDTKHTSLEKDIKSLEISRAEINAKASLTSLYVAYGLTVVSIIIALVSLFHEMG